VLQFLLIMAPPSPRATRATAGSKAVSNEKSDKGSSERRRALSDLELSSSASDVGALVRSVLSESLSDGPFIDRLVNKLADQLSEKIIERVTAVVTASLLERLETADRRIEELSREVTALREAPCAHAGRMGNRLDGLAQYQRRNNLRIFGVPENEGEDATESIRSLFAEKLGVEVLPAEIDRCHRVGRRPPVAEPSGRPRAVLVRFVSYQSRSRVMSNRRRLKGTSVTIREDLTQDRATLYKQMAEKFGFRNVWTRDGRIFWRDAGVVRSNPH
jgi:hypothetical protein